MSFSVAFWNIENFYGSRSRSDKVEDHIRSLTPGGGGPDLIGLCEVKDKTLMRELLTRNFGDYDFAMSDTAVIPRGRRKSSQIEILAGWRRGAFEQVMYTQRVEITAGRTTIRPGVLVNVRTGGNWYSVLLLHLKSGPNTESYNLRQKQVGQIFRLKKKLDSLEPGRRPRPARLVVAGDLNLMGNGTRGKPRKVSGDQEVTNLGSQARRNAMTLETKEHPDTFNQRKKRKQRKLTSNLDHVLTSHSVDLETLGRNAAGERFTVRVVGWNQLVGDTQALHEFEDTLSDHSALYFEVKT